MFRYVLVISDGHDDPRPADELVADHWKRMGPPVVMKDGWKMT